MTLTLASSRLTPLVASWTSKSRARVVAVSAIAGPRRRPALSTTTTGNAATGVVPIVVGRRARGDAVLIKSSDGVGKRRGSVRCAAVPGPEFITPEAMFNFENVAIFPFWAAMIALPDNKVTKTVMGSYAVPILLGAIYVYLTWYSFSDPRILDAFSTGKPDLAALAKGFSYEWCMAVGWAHFIAMDLFVGRWIYLDARKNDVFAAHSLVLCLFFGPTGVMSHVTTRAITGLVRGKKLEDVMATTTNNNINNNGSSSSAAASE